MQTTETLQASQETHKLYGQNAGQYTCIHCTTQSGATSGGNGADSLQILTIKLRIKVTLEKATKAQRWSRDIALFFNLGARCGAGGQRHASAVLPPGKRPATNCIGGWVGPRAGLDGYGKSRPHRDSIPGPSSP